MGSESGFRKTLSKFQTLTKFKEAPYRDFGNPYITPVKNTNGQVTDYVLKYPQTFSEQMFRYAKEYSFLPDTN